MCVKRYLEKSIWNLYFRLKGMGIMSFIPVFGLYGLIPVLNVLAYYFKNDKNMLYDNIVRMSQYLIPLFSVWIILFILEHCIEEPMHELLYMNNRIKLWELLLLYIGFCVLMLPLFVVYTRLFPELWWLYLKILVLNLFYLSSAYAVSYLFGKMIPAAVLVLYYTVYAVMESTTGLTGTNLFPLEVYTELEFMQWMRGYLILTMILLAVGVGFNYYYPERNR